MSHYDVTALLTIFSFVLLAVWGAYLKGCRDTWRQADEMLQVQSIFPTEETSSNPLDWPEMPFAANCQECQAEQEPPW
jgi:hypothetical protein